MIDESFVGREAWNNKDAPLLYVQLYYMIWVMGRFHIVLRRYLIRMRLQEIITGNTEVNEVLSRVSETFPQEVADVINKTHKNKLVISMISSQIDADRMDYLQRDAYFTGVSYGTFDMERILRLMRPSKMKYLLKKVVCML